MFEGFRFFRYAREKALLCHARETGHPTAQEAGGFPFARE
jgi:hypothetical protein